MIEVYLHERLALTTPGKVFIEFPSETLGRLLE